MNQVYMEMTDPDTILLSNRSGKDRRTKSSFNIRLFLFGGKRAKIRRQADTNRIFYVDQFSTGLFFTIVTIIFLSVIDALLTLHLLKHGGQEANPVMAYFLQFGPYTFFIFKYLLTVIPTICLLMFRNIVVRVLRISARWVLYVMAVFYLVVVGMEIYFVSNTAYTPDGKTAPKLFTDSQIICQVDTFNPYPTSKGKIRI
jgi:hypothetical protein